MAMSATFFTLAVVAIVDLTGRERWAGILLALFNGSAAVSALIVGRLMDRYGRRPGLAFGYAALRGRLDSAAPLAVWQGSSWLLLAMAVPVRRGPRGRPARSGRGRRHVPQPRARADGRDHRRRRHAGRIFGAPVVAAVEAATDSTVAPWLLIPASGRSASRRCCSSAPTPATWRRSRSETARESGGGRPLGALLHLPPFRAAVVAIAVAQTSMVAVMGVTPVVIDGYGGSALAIALVISFHMVGMFAIAPVIGALLDRYGRRPGLLVGGVLTAIGAILGSFTEVTPSDRHRPVPRRPRLVGLLPGRDGGDQRPHDGRRARRRARLHRSRDLGRVGGGSSRRRVRARVLGHRDRRHRDGGAHAARARSRSAAPRAFARPLGRPGAGEVAATERAGPGSDTGSGSCR